MEDRIQKAVELFKSGYNCSQSVVAAFADMYGFTQEQALRMSASFGGGIGRMRETCGAPLFRKSVLLNIIASVPVQKWLKKRQEFGRNISKSIQNELLKCFFITKTVKKCSIKCYIT